MLILLKSYKSCTVHSVVDVALVSGSLNRLCVFVITVNRLLKSSVFLPVGCEYGDKYSWCDGMPQIFCPQYQPHCCKSCHV